MYKIFLIISLFFSSFTFGQDDIPSSISLKKYISENSKKISEKNISIHYSIGKNLIKAIKYFKDNDNYKLVLFENDFLIKEIKIENDELFNFVDKHLKNFTYLSKSIDDENFKKYHDLYNDSNFLNRQIGIKYKFLHFNHFILNKNLYKQIDKDEYLKLSYTFLNILAKHFEEIVK